jgi:hypothetical protein
MNVLETHVLNLIGENPDSPDVFVDTDAGLEPIRESINDAIEEITLVTGSYKEKYQVLLVSDQPFYRLRLSRGDIAWITDAWLVNTQKRLTQTDVFPLSQDNPRWLQNSGTPEAYIPIGHNIIGVWPVPTAEEVLELTMVVTPERMKTSTDRIRLRETFKWAAVDYAVGEFYASRGDAKEASGWHQKYLNALGVLGNYPKSQERNFYSGNRNQTNRP